MYVKDLLAKLSKYHWSPEPLHRCVYHDAAGRPLGFGTIVHHSPGIANLVWANLNPIDRTDKHLAAIQEWTSLLLSAKAVVDGCSIDDRLLLTSPEEFREWLSRFKVKVPPEFAKYALKALGNVKV